MCEFQLWILVLAIKTPQYYIEHMDSKVSCFISMKITHTVTGHTPHFIHHYGSRDHRQPQATGIQVAQEFTRCMEHLSPAQGLESALARVWLYQSWWAQLLPLCSVSYTWTEWSLYRQPGPLAAFPGLRCMLGKTYTTCLSGRIW